MAFLQPLYRGIVQLVEYRSPKPQVVGSNPTAPVISDLRSRNVDGGFFVCRVVTPPSASSPVRRPLTNLFQKCRKLGILPELPGKLLIILAGEFFYGKI